jgi:hypothetical protein
MSREPKTWNEEEKGRGADRLLPRRWRIESMTIQEYWRAIRAQRDELGKQFPQGYCYVVSIPRSQTTRGGLVIQVDLDNAARCLAEGSHRLPTASEITAHEEAQTRTRRALQVAAAPQRASYALETKRG